MNVSGRVLFNPNSSARFNDPVNIGIPGVAIVLQRSGSGSTSAGIIVLTDSGGNYEVRNVPSGTYQIVEAWGMSGAVSSPANFSGARVVTSVPKDPPARGISNLPEGANRINSLSPNTLFVDVVDTDLSNQSFLDAPTKVVPLQLNAYVTIGNNLITKADGGTWGTLPNGSPVQDSPATAPYNVTQAFRYIQYQAKRPADGEYSVSNTITNNNFGTWWNMSDYSTGDETGRMQIVNGDFPGQYFFEERSVVKQHTNYVFSTWVCNVDYEVGSALPKLRVNVEQIDGTVIFSKNLSGNLEVTSLPTWNQVGTVFNSGSNTELIVKFLSEGGAIGGNDFLIDEIRLFQLEPTPVTSFPKSVNHSVVIAGANLEYILAFTNAGPSTITNAVFKDKLPSEVTIISGSLMINNVIADETKIVTGIPIGTILPGSTVNIHFSVVTNKDITANTMIENTGQMDYSFVDSTGETRKVILQSEAAATVILSATCPICPTGPMGGTGIQGPIGPTGIQGAKGSVGARGATGPEGPQGLLGIEGPVGLMGPEGIAGPEGDRGATGPRGLVGPMGQEGPQGDRGLIGAKGDRGPIGNMGPVGPRGVTGPIGLQGEKGTTGSQGEMGTIGATGPTGPRGPAGPMGERGVTGLEGPMGPIGPQGYIGPQGQRGLAGIQGIRGLIGPMGTRGEQGIEGVRGPKGDRGIRGPQGAQGLQGQMGPRGLQGVEGSIGPMGPQGIEGPTGPIGPTGKCECGPEVYGQFILERSIECTCKGSIPFICTLTGVKPIRVNKEKIQLYPGYVYYISYSMIAHLYKGENELQAGLWFNNQMIGESISQVDLTVEQVKKVTLTGSALIVTTPILDDISLKYDSNAYEYIDICYASVKMITVAKL